MFFQKKHQYSEQQITSREDKKISLLNKVFYLLELLAIITIFATLVKGGLFLAQPSNFPIRKVKVIATYNNLDPNLVRNTVSSHIKNGFFDLDTLTLQHELIKLPWVYSASIQRNWPNTITINLTEQIPLAKWKDTALVNQDGIIITPPPINKSAENLPVFSGPETSSLEILQAYKNMQHLLQPLNLTINKLNLNLPFFWTLELNNKTKLLLNYDDYAEKLQNFTTAYPKIIASQPNATTETIDLRYKNGLSIKWR